MANQLINLTELYQQISSAHRALRPQVAITPFYQSLELSELTGCEVYLKCEHVLPTGSFKFRGACNKIRLIDSKVKKGGVIVASSGNHGQAVALAGKIAGVSVTVYAANSIAPIKQKAIKAYGAELIILNASGLDVELEARRQASVQGKVFISPYNDPEVIAGQGTVGMELLEQCDDLGAIFTSVGGGGLISGIATAVKTTKPHIQLIGCWPENASSLYTCLKEGKIIPVQEYDTLSDGTAGEVEPGSITFPICQKLVDHTLCVSEEDIKQAMNKIAETDQWIIEGSAGVALAALFKEAHRFQGKKVAVIICGRNISMDKYLKVVRR